MHYHFEVSGIDMSLAGKASTEVKKILARLGVAPEEAKRVAIAMYEGEINMVIHAGGGSADVEINPEYITVTLQDNGPGIVDIDLAMREGYSTAPEWIREQGFGAGMGLPNMKRNVDDFKIDSVIGKGTTITMVIHIGASKAKG
jgi:anti-sigma regulatory factor (Ser/Thr protein kinase)